MRVTSGTLDAPQVAARYGAVRGATAYRVFAQGTRSNASRLPSEMSASDEWADLAAGVRTDRVTDRDSYMLDGRVSRSRVHALWVNLDPSSAQIWPVHTAPSDATTGSLVGRYTVARDRQSSLQVQSFVDLGHWHEPVAEYHHLAADVDLQYRRLGGRHDLVTGAGYRYIRESFRGGTGYALTPPVASESLVSAFVQDELTLLDKRLAVTLGTKLQTGTAVDGGLQPTARIMWHPSLRQHLWASLSRALRTPSLQERGIQVTYPPTPGPGGVPVSVKLTGDPTYRSESFVDREVDTGGTSAPWPPSMSQGSLGTTRGCARKSPRLPW